MCLSPLYRVSRTFENYTGDIPPYFSSRRPPFICSYKEFNDAVLRVGVPEIYFTRISCGSCLECRLKKSHEWSIRCQLESLYHDSVLFCTFTYEDAKLPLKTIFSGASVGILVKEHFQGFMKRLRAHFGYPIRFYCSGEYGDTTHRPHYHAILFGLSLPDLQFLFSRRVKSDVIPYYSSDLLNSLWSYGNVIIASSTSETISYTSRYIMKKSNPLPENLRDFSSIKNFDDLIRCGEIPPQFSLMSRRPGIGRRYFEEHKDLIYSIGEIPGFNTNLSYFDRLYDESSSVGTRSDKDLYIIQAGSMNGAGSAGERELKSRKIILDRKLRNLLRDKI